MFRIRVKNDHGGRVVLEQDLDQARNRVVLTRQQLDETLDFLTQNASSNDRSYILPVESMEDIFIRVFANDGSFTIRQGSQKLAGQGDILPYLEYPAGTRTPKRGIAESVKTIDTFGGTQPAESE